MVDRRFEILNGMLTFPQQIINLLNVNDKEQEIINDFWSNLWNNFLREKPCDTVTWLTCFDNPMLFNKALYHLSKAGWITSMVDQNYASISLNPEKLLKWVSKDELTSIIYRYKFNKYRMTYTKSKLSDIVQINGKHIPTGLIREGFMKAGNCRFSYDTKYILKYRDQIADNLMKGLAGSTKEITYQEILSDLTDWYAIDDASYTLGNCIIDSRGRAIFQCSKKVFNPVSSKEARAVLRTAPAPLHDFASVYMAVAELFGYRGQNAEDKASFGYNKFKTRELPSIENLHERIWCERIYENLEHPEEWTVPIEIDALASQIQMIGVLLNNHTYLDQTNLINPEVFGDIWTVNYCSRLHVKKALTPMLYGSSKKPKDLWDHNKLEYTQPMLNAILKDLAIGKYSEANKFKDFIINNVNPKTKMKVKIFNEEFNIECNRFKWQEQKRVEYFIYHTAQSKLKKITREVAMVPDTQQFKRYFQTLLIHNLDSQVANHVCLQLDWILPNHDAFTLHPNDVVKCRKVYTQKMEEIYHNRHTILQNYFDSIGITEEFKFNNEPEVDKFSGYCLK